MNCTNWQSRQANVNAAPNPTKNHGIITDAAVPNQYGMNYRSCFPIL
jgi:hypothetical protein